MKKFLFTVGAIMCVALLSVCMSSCDEEKEPLSAIYTVSTAMTNEQKKITSVDGNTEAKANYEALYAEFQQLVRTDTWTVDINKKNQDEVLKREDQNAKKKFDDMVAKVNAFKAKLDKLDKTLVKNQFDWDFDAVVTSVRGELKGNTILDTKTIAIHYDGMTD